MSILSKKIIVPVSSRYQNYYKSKGYEIPTKISSRGKVVADQSKYIQVNIDDLPEKYNCKIEVMCENPACRKTQLIQRSEYIKNCNNHDGKYFCHSCSMKLYNSGENNYLWKNIPEEDRSENRNYPEYREFISKVLFRDNYKCVCCGRTSSDGVRLNVHHLNGYNWFYAGRIDETNAVTLCVDCHCNFHCIYGKGNNSKEQFMEWMNISKLEIEKCKDYIPSHTRKVYCYEEDKIYSSVLEFAEAHEYKSTIHIYHACDHIISRTIRSLHVFWYDEYLNMTQDQILGYVNNTSEIITLSKYKKMKEAELNGSN